MCQGEGRQGRYKGAAAPQLAACMPGTPAQGRACQRQPAPPFNHNRTARLLQSVKALTRAGKRVPESSSLSAPRTAASPSVMRSAAASMTSVACRRSSSAQQAEARVDYRGKGLQRLDADEAANRPPVRPAVTYIS